MTATNRADSCVPQAHVHVGICQRAGYANGRLDGRADLVDQLAEVRKGRDAAENVLLSVSETLTKWNGEDGSLVIDAVARNTRGYVREVRTARNEADS